MTNAQNNVKYGKFTVEELFNVKGTKSTDAGKVHFVGKQDGDAQFIGRTNANYGLQGYVNSKDFAFEPNKANTISVSQVGTITAQYRDFPYYTSQNITKLSASFLNRQIGLYICSAINQWLRGAQFEGYHTLKMADLKKQQLVLPVTPSGTPDFEYMEERIRELEEERIRELEAYLQVTGLSDATLTDEEQVVLDKMNNAGITQAKFKIGSLFDIQKVRGINKSGLTVPNDNNCYDYVTRTSKDNGVESQTGLVKARELNEAGTYSLGLLQMTFFYRNKPWYAGQFVRKIVPKQKLSQKTMLYFLSIFNKMRPVLLSTLVRHVDDKFTNLEIDLPVTPSGDIDFDFMETYIMAIEKQSIRGVIEYKDKMIQTTKDVVNAN